MVQNFTTANKTEITIGVLGQDGHGKTALTTAITQSLARQDSSVVTGEEIVISIEGNGEDDRSRTKVYETDTRRYKHVDCRSHRDIVKNFILHRIPLHGAILVVSAVDGVTTQTREQVRLAQETGVASMVVFLNKCELTDDFDLLDTTETEVRSLLSEHGLPIDTPFIRGSATSALQSLATSRSDICTSKIRELLDAMDMHIPVPQRLEDKTFLMHIDEQFYIRYSGNVVLGSVERGICRINSFVELVGFKPTRTCVGIDMEQDHKKSDHLTTGKPVGMLLRGLQKGDVQCGQVLAAPGTIQAYSKFRAVLYLFTREEGSDLPDLSATIYSFFIRTVEIKGTLNIEEEAPLLRGGDIVRLVVELEVIVAMEIGLRFTLRKEGHAIGMGVVTEVLS